MQIINEIINLRQRCQESLVENNEEMAIAFIVNVCSHEIWGGLGDRDEDIYYCINKNGWIKKIVITETGAYQKSNSGMVSEEIHAITDEDIQSVLNGNCDIFVIKNFINFYNKIFEIK